MNKESLEALEQNLNLIIETSRHMGIMGSNFQEHSQAALNHKVTSLVKCLSDLDLIKEDFKEVNVPVDVLKYIDSEQSPVLYTRDSMKSALAKNEEVNGKINEFKQFRDILLDEFKKNFTDDYEAYMRTRNETNESSHVNTGATNSSIQANFENISNDLNFL